MVERGTGAVIDARDVWRDYQRGTGTVAALRGVDLTVSAGERVAIMGPSGSGKSTLLGLLGGLDRPTAGTITVMGQDLSQCSRQDLALFRRRNIGYVLQQASLLPMLTVQENIELPLMLRGVDRVAREERVGELLDLVGLREKTGALPEELSGGQQQRVSVARALAPRPSLLLADEPAGSLDSITAGAILSLIVQTLERDGIAFVLVTHERDDTRYANRVLMMRDGQMVGEDVLC